MTTAVTLVVLSEDSGAQGWSSLHRIVRHTCDLLVDGLDWHEGVEIVPRGEVPSTVQKICAGNLWKSTRPEDLPRKGELFRYVARLLAEEPTGTQFVMFHVDGDCVWSEGSRRPSPNLRRFEDVVRTGVRRALVERYRAPRTTAEVDAMMARLSVIAPHYAIEAWLYQATDRAARLCVSRACAGRHVAQYQAWARARPALDELGDLKRLRTEHDLHCLRGDDKNELARGFPAQAVWEAGSSYTAWVDALLRDEALLAALRHAVHSG
ncbi:MAG: hypothetical protein R3A48_21945 [Polyangiales bacterium]